MATSRANFKVLGAKGSGIKSLTVFRKMMKDLNENGIQVIENGKVIERQSN